MKKRLLLTTIVVLLHFLLLMITSRIFIENFKILNKLNQLIIFIPNTVLKYFLPQLFTSYNDYPPYGIFIILAVDILFMFMVWYTILFLLEKGRKLFKEL
jgi:hypothetical protein